MSNNPIKTVVNGNTIAKICVEDVRKLHEFVNQVNDSTLEKFDKIDIEFPLEIKNVGKAKCTSDDKFNEEIGNEIAFRKVKLQANIKKFKFLTRVARLYSKALSLIMKRRNKIYTYIEKDIKAIREYNPEYSVDY